jgi:hypothetical protein
MKRTLIDNLISWKNSSKRKPLILKGSRQVGKTYLLREFAKSHYQNTIYCNFEKTSALGDIFKLNLDPQRIIRYLETLFKTPILAEKTLIFFDEIQECGQALTSLKYFNEEASQYHIAAAGSLLGVLLVKDASFPVGNVDFLELHPLSFLEFLSALDLENLRDLLLAHNLDTPLPIIFHDQLIEALRQYGAVGGMPEVVAEYVLSKDVHAARLLQESIIKSYLQDFAKHAPPDQIVKITQVWESLPRMLVKEQKKFIYSEIQKGARARQYEVAIQWLVDAGLVLRCSRINHPQIPLAAHFDPNFFKLYLFDVGLLAAAALVPPELSLTPQLLFDQFHGALSENFAAQELTTYFGQPLYYWTSNANAEVDFILQLTAEAMPLEIKAGTNPKAKSLSEYNKKYRPSQSLRGSLLNFNVSGNILNLPLYAFSRIKG